MLGRALSGEDEARNFRPTKLMRVATLCTFSYTACPSVNACMLNLPIHSVWLSFMTNPSGQEQLERVGLMALRRQSELQFAALQGFVTTKRTKQKKLANNSSYTQYQLGALTDQEAASPLLECECRTDCHRVKRK